MAAHKAMKTALHGPALLNSPRLNKGSAFSRNERKLFGLESFLPYEVQSLEVQSARAYSQICKLPTTILRHAYLASLRDQNQVLFYHVMQQHLKELLGVLYTPGAAEAVEEYSHVFRRPIGCYLTYPNRKTLREQLELHLKDDSTPVGETYNSTVNKEAIDLIVVTDSEAILGIGDQGVGGLTIATSKSALYTLGAGVDPNRILPVVLDVGTNNQHIVQDPQYLGWKHPRLVGKDYDDFVDDFVHACREVFPHAVIHFEDFGIRNAHRILDRFQHKLPVFNDDIQGTGAVTLAALIAALSVTKAKLSDQRVVIYGAGSAGMGIADQIKDGLVVLEGLSEEDACSRFWCLDKRGLLLESMGDTLGDSQKGYARPIAEVSAWQKEQDKITLLEVVKNVKPTVLVGTSTQAGSFTEEIIREMAKHTDRPIIFPMSNPTSLCEILPKDALQWTDGKALLATGSPFEPVQLPGGRSYDIAQTNNALYYPALGFGSILARSKLISKPMIMAGIHALGKLSPALADPTASLLPDLSQVRRVSLSVTAAVIKSAFEEGIATDGEIKHVVEANDNKALEEFIKANMWDAVYQDLEAA